MFHITGAHLTVGGRWLVVRGEHYWILAPINRRHLFEPSAQNQIKFEFDGQTCLVYPNRSISHSVIHLLFCTGMYANYSISILKPLHMWGRLSPQVKGSQLILRSQTDLYLISREHKRKPNGRIKMVLFIHPGSGRSEFWRLLSEVLC